VKGPLDVVWLAETGGWGSLRVVVHFDLLAVWAGTETLEARDIDMQESKFPCIAWRMGNLACSDFCTLVIDGVSV
jgi:hypothetical protein